MNGHPPLVRRIVRPLVRLVGTPAGVAATLVLRLTARKAGVALIYHSVEQRAGDPERELVPPHDVALFERQIRYVLRHYRVVHASELQEAARARRRGQRFPVAITFDDDLACHEGVALPVLRRLGATATFFLSGASLDHPFAYHFERLQRAWDARAPELPVVVTGVPGTTEPSTLHGLGLALELLGPEERDEAADRLLAVAGPDPDDAGIRRAQVRALAEAGMTVGFHTFRHDSLTALGDEQLAEAMERGRAELETAAGTAVDVIGYPHGRADERVADAARRAGFRVGYTTQRVPVTPDSDPLLLGRIGPSLRSVGALAVELALTLVKGGGSARPSPARGHAPS